jgi:hypothetical protein
MTISFQARDEIVNQLGFKKAFAQKWKCAQALEAQGDPVALNVVIHRHKP